MEQRLARPQKDKRLVEAERDSMESRSASTRCMHCDKERLTATVTTLEREGWRAKGGTAHGPTAEWEAESPRADRVVGGWGGQNPTSPAPGSSRPGRGSGIMAEAGHGKMSTVTSSLRMALLQAKMEVEVGSVAPHLGRVE